MIKNRLIIPALLILTLIGCEDNVSELPPKLEEGKACEIYYIDNAGQTLVLDNTSIDGDTQEQQAFNAYEKMQEVSINDGRRSAVKEGIEVNSMRIDSGILDIDFNSAYHTMTPGEELTFKTAVVYTLTSLDFIDFVRITVEGSPLKMTNGQSMGKLGREDIVIDGNISAEPTNYEILTLYFTTFEGNTLGTEIREVEVNPNQPIERYIVEQIIKGPINETLRSVIPADTKIREISTADGICYVDLSTEFATKQSGTEKDAVAAIYSIVNSLGEIESVNKVQFLIDGEKVENYRNTMDLSTAIEPDYNITFDQSGEQK
ncbi:lipoprotein LpqB [Clostridiales bacterium]|nr:lipoprotein LpqB [Clostridiales bacterium]